MLARLLQSLAVVVAVAAIESMPAEAQPLVAVARFQSGDLIQGPGLAALSAKGVLLTFDKNGVRSDKLTPKLLGAHGDGRILWGRTFLVAVGDPNRFGRPNDKKPKSVFGTIETVRALGRSEVWQVTVDNMPELALVDHEDHLRRLPSLPLIGEPPPGLSAIGASACTKPIPWRLSRGPGGAAAMIMECDVRTDLRIETIHSEGTTTVKRYKALGPYDFEPNEFVMLSDGTPVLAGRKSGHFALARAVADGSWNIQTTTDATTLVTSLTVDEAGQIWSIGLGAGADGKDVWTLRRGLDTVPIATPDGQALAPRELVSDFNIGVVVKARVVGSDYKDPYWLMAAHKPRGPFIDLP